MAKPSFTAEKRPPKNWAAAWPAAAEFPVEGPPDRRSDALGKLQRAFRTQFPASFPAASIIAPPSDGGPQHGIKATPAQVAGVERLLRENNLNSLADYGPAIIAH